MPKTFVCLPLYEEQNRSKPFHNFVRVIFPTLDQLRARNSDIGPDLIVELLIENFEPMEAPDIFMIGSYILVSENSIKHLDSEFPHCYAEVKITSSSQKIRSKNYRRLIIDREYEIIDMKASEFSERKVLDILLRTPLKLVVSTEAIDFRGLIHESKLPGLILCDFNLAKSLVKSELSGLKFFHPFTPPTSQKDWCWLSDRGLEKNLPWDGSSKTIENELLVSF